MDEAQLRSKGFRKLGDGSWVKGPEPRPMDTAVQDAKPQPPIRKALGNVHAVPKGSSERITVHFTLYRCVSLDESNAAASVKAIEDSLRYVGIIPDDSKAVVRLIVDQEKVEHRTEEGTRVRISYP